MNDLCPTAQDLRFYLHGKTSDSDTETIELHLVDCQKCQIHLEILSEESDSLMHLVSEAAAIPLVAGSRSERTQSRRSLNEFRASSESSWRGANDMADSMTMIRDYRLLELLGQGGMGSVYRALHVRLNRQVAIKILKSDRIGADEAVSRFAREIRLLAQLEHPNIVRAVDAGEHDGLPYFVMEFISGVNLGQLVQRLGPLPVPESCSIIRLAAVALQYAHEQKVLHRDIKPSNVMITAEGAVKLLDLGLAQILELEVDDGVSRTDQVLGTLAYMSPEQLSGRNQVTMQSDIFSLGVTLHELLTGQRPFERRGMPPFVSDIRSVRPDVDDNLNALVSDMLALDSSARPASMAEVQSRLQAISPDKNLTSVIAQYYRWENRNPDVSTSELARTNTASSTAERTGGQSRANSMRVAAIAKTGHKSNHFFNMRTAIWMAGTVMGIALTTIGWLILFPYQKAVPAIDSSEGIVSVQAEGKVGLQLLAEGSVKAENEGGQIYDLKLGESKIPIGKYTIRFVNSPTEFQQDGDTLEVFNTATSIVHVRPVLTKPFQYPDIPDQPGAFGIYHGSIWRDGWDGVERPLAFNIYLEVVAIDRQPSTPSIQWLKMEVTSKGSEDSGLLDDYSETAYLSFDAKKWETERQLEIREGWIAANSIAIEGYLNANPSLSGGRTELIVRFDRRHDLIGEMKSVPLPTRRLSIQDVLSLFFGQEMHAAGGAINSVRALLPNMGDRKTSLQLIDAGRGEQQCFVVSSRDQARDRTIPGFMLALRKSDSLNPFGFVQLEVNFPARVVANCLKKNANVTESHPKELLEKLSYLRKGEFKELALPNKPESKPSKPEKRPTARNFQQTWLSKMAWDFGFALGDSTRSWSKPDEDFDSTPKSEPIPQPKIEPPSIPAVSSTKRFDLATLPPFGASQTFHGIIAFNADHSETLSFTVRMLGEEQIEDRVFRWIDVEVNSRLQNVDYSEFSRVLVDAAEYSDSNRFLIKKGWIAFGDKGSVFAIPPDGNLDSIIDQRLSLQPKPMWNRIGVIDVYSMLFNINLKPRTNICSLRDEFAGKLPNMPRKLTQEVIRHKSGDTFACERWEPPLILPQLNYSFVRSAQVPFGFISVRLVRNDLRIQLDMESHRTVRTDEWSNCAFGTPSQLDELLSNNQKRLQPIPNWQVWTWSDADKTYKAWAEFGGTIESQGAIDILLRDKAGNEIRVPETLLSQADQSAASKGRFWAKKPFADASISRWRVIKEDNRKLNELTFAIPSSPNLAKCQLSHLEPIDFIWVKKLRLATDAKHDTANNPRAWQGFAGYMR